MAEQQQPSVLSFTASGFFIRFLISSAGFDFYLKFHSAATLRTVFGTKGTSSLFL